VCPPRSAPIQSLEEASLYSRIATDQLWINQSEKQKPKRDPKTILSMRITSHIRIAERPLSKQLSSGKVGFNAQKLIQAAFHSPLFGILKALPPFASPGLKP